MARGKKRGLTTTATRKSTRGQNKRRKTGSDEEEDTSSAKWFEDDDHETLMVFDGANVKGSSKIAAFDMDHTIVRPKKGVFPKSRSDWKWMWDTEQEEDFIKDKLVKLHKDGFKIVIFTNQTSCDPAKPKGPGKTAEITGKIKDIVKILGIPVQAFISRSADITRKPFTTMWDALELKYNDDIKIDTEKSFYCGDAAGRAKDWKKGHKKDFSASDRKFAANVGVKFYTPEEYFLEEEEAVFDWRTPSPQTFIDAGEEVEQKVDNLTKDTQEIVVCVGFPASGKSSFSKKHFVAAGYTWVNQDTLKSKAKCIKVCKDAVKEGKSVIIDNTNTDVKTRSSYIKIANDNDVDIRCLKFDTSLHLARHLNFFRTLTKGIRRVPDIGYNLYKKRHQPPTKSEGFSEVRTISFVPEFTDRKTRNLFLQWLD